MNRHAKLLRVCWPWLVSSWVCGLACSQPYPAKPIRIIIPLGAGGGTDTLTRIVAPRAAEFLGQQFIVENRPGAGTQIGTELVARAAPDGYTLLNVDTSFPSNPSLNRKLPYDSIRDFAPVSLLASAPVVLVVHASVPVHTLKELLALAKARPGQLNFAFGGHGTATHMGVELFRSAAKVDVTLIPYKGGGPAAADVIAGQVAMMFAGPASVKQHVVSGRLRAIAITGATRNAAMPAVPTFIESALPGVDSGSYWGTLAPAATPREIINTVSNAYTKALQLLDIHSRLIALGYDPIGGTPDEFAHNLRNEMAKWARIVKQSGIKID